MKRVHKSARISVSVAALLGVVYLILILTEPGHQYDFGEGISVEGHDDHIHIVYQPVMELDPESITAITAYLPENEVQIRIENRKVITGEMQSDCTGQKEWVTRYAEPKREVTLSHREAVELRNLYSKIIPDFRIERIPEGEGYGLISPVGCMIIYSDHGHVFLQFGSESAQGYSRYLRVNETGPVYVVSRYFYTTLEEFLTD